ncbi:hypothetical protein M422DRAFT_189907 [Sphaerobolus stellatus SS14]|uniref:Protein kinase domain-containing protein n=1 Tax=Sphaerobolus stellatus (strain SS14) TaxID=990650 RepID=A0A0C9U2A3_SPHS4|nr:hypothetical protein M422DRAFT_189907 [Sphaerobolus stellatus SS14]
MTITQDDYSRQLEEFKQARTLGDATTIYPTEQFWKKHQPWLASKGYMLRPRYHAGWVPSWTETNRRPDACEDGLINFVSYLLDATRISDQLPVILKMIWRASHPKEADLTLRLSSPPFGLDPQNHCVPVLDVLRVPGYEELDLLVMPLLRSFDDPPMKTVGEFVGFAVQIFEGMRFLHRHRVAHRDCTGQNIMMDANDMYPQGFHPIKMNLTPDLKRRAKYHSRVQCPPTYYIIDYGLSIHYDQGGENPKELPITGGDKTVPEFRGGGYNTPLDPFPTDVYYIGNMLRKLLKVRWANIDFISELTNDMTLQDPTKRPTMDVVVDRFEKIVQSQSDGKLRSPLVPRHDFFLTKFIKYGLGTVNKLLGRINGVPSIPPQGV